MLNWNRILLFSLFLLLFSCSANSTLDDSENDVEEINSEEVEKIILHCKSDSSFKAVEVHDLELIEKINEAEPEGFVKGLGTRSLQIVMKSADTIQLWVLDNWLKWPKSGDRGYKLDLPEDYFDKICD